MATTMPETRSEAAQLRLMAFLSPAFPVGGFSYSHGLERAAHDGLLPDASALQDWLADLIALGSGWNDAVLFAEAHRRVRVDADLLDLFELAEALAGSEERHRESMLQTSQSGDDPDGILPLRALARIGVVGYPAMRVDHRFKDGDTIRLGPLALTAHITGGHTRGCTSWSFHVRDGDRLLNVVSACDLGRLATSQYPGQAADLERSFRVLRGLPVDIWVTCHARWWGRYRKFVASVTAKDPVGPFIDPEGYRAYIDAAEAELRSGRLH